MLDEFGTKIHLLRDPTQGGVTTVLAEIARDTNLGIDLRQRPISIAEQVASSCEILDLDPLYVANEGIFLSKVDSSLADEYLAKLRNHTFCSNASIIGEAIAYHPRPVESRIGGRRVVNMPIGEQLPRIC